MGYFEQVGQIGVTGNARLVTMALRGDLVPTADNPGIFSRAVLTELGEEFLETRVQLALDPIAVEAQRNIARRGHASVYPEAAFPASRASQGYPPRPPPPEKKDRPPRHLSPPQPDY